MFDSRSCGCLVVEEARYGALAARSNPRARMPPRCWAVSCASLPRPRADLLSYAAFGSQVIVATLCGALAVLPLSSRRPHRPRPRSYLSRATRAARAAGRARPRAMEMQMAVWRRQRRRRRAGEQRRGRAARPLETHGSGAKGHGKGKRAGAARRHMSFVGHGTTSAEAGGAEASESQTQSARARPPREGRARAAGARGRFSTTGYILYTTRIDRCEKNQLIKLYVYTSCAPL